MRFGATRDAAADLSLSLSLLLLLSLWRVAAAAAAKAAATQPSSHLLEQNDETGNLSRVACATHFKNV